MSSRRAAFLKSASRPLLYALELPACETTGIERRVHVEVKPRGVVDDLTATNDVTFIRGPGIASANDVDATMEVEE